MHCTFLHFYLKEGPKGSEKTPHTAKIVMKFLLYDKVKYFYQHFSLVAFGAQWKNSTDMPAASRKSGKTEGWAVGLVGVFWNCQVNQNMPKTFPLSNSLQKYGHMAKAPSVSMARCL